MRVTVLFFGVLTEVTGTGKMICENVNSLENLRLRIASEHPGFVHYDFRVSLNNEITSEDMNLKDGDEVAFLPPFAGG